MVDSLLTTNKKSPRSRLGRTIVLGSVAVVVTLIALADSWGIERVVLWDYFLTSLLFVGVFAGVGIVAGWLVWLVKKRLR